jgi:hypothetical protein
MKRISTEVSLTPLLPLQTCDGNHRNGAGYFTVGDFLNDPENIDLTPELAHR